MANSNVTPPRLPQAPVEYNQLFMQQVLQILNLYFQQLNNDGPLQGTTLNLSSINQTTGKRVVILPTQTSLANLRTGDVYYDTSNANVLKIKI
jgi:hypothetical protein